MNYECFDVSVEEHVAHIQLSRPEKRNSMVSSFWKDLPEIVSSLDASGEIRAIVISSTGPHFTSGIDLSLLSNSAGNEESQSTQHRAGRFYHLVKRLQDSFSSFEHARVPVLAAVQGGCIGAGVDLVSACDMRYSTKDAFFTIQETNIGMTADVGTFPRLSHLMPDGVVRELAYTGRPLNADEALQWGLVNAVFDSQDELLNHVMGIAKQIALKAPLAVHGCKKMILHSRDHTVADTLDYVGLWNASFLNHQEIMESMVALKEKRKPEYASLPAIGADDAEFKLP